MFILYPAIPIKNKNYNYDMGRFDLIGMRVINFTPYIPLDSRCVYRELLNKFKPHVAFTKTMARLRQC